MTLAAGGALSTLALFSLDEGTLQTIPRRLLLVATDTESEILNKHRAGAQVTEICTKLRLPPPEVAQHIQPIKIKRFLSEVDITKLLTEAKSARDSHAVGVIERNSTGGAASGSGGVWRTSYLHTSDWFESNYKEMADRIRTAALEAALAQPTLCSMQTQCGIHMSILIPCRMTIMVVAMQNT
eukprot:SAG31_NODE_146_length_22601_cov_56.529192_1_plen_183_part_00